MQPALCLTVPGLNGSGCEHWQTWAEREIPNCRRVTGIDFHRPVIAAWADAIRQDVKSCSGSVILLAHSFGCLASVMAVADQEVKVCAVVLVAPASPVRFGASGLLSEAEINHGSPPSLLACMPDQPLNTAGLMIASNNDPWLSVDQAVHWSDLWGLRLQVLNNAGHINVDSGFGRWQAVHRLIADLREELSPLPLGRVDQHDLHAKNRFSALAKARRMTREAIQ